MANESVIFDLIITSTQCDPSCLSLPNLGIKGMCYNVLQCLEVAIFKENQCLPNLPSPNSSVKKLNWLERGPKKEEKTYTME